jgi:ligand-binding SRPBCC domain-containing protein
MLYFSPFPSNSWEKQFTIKKQLENIILIQCITYNLMLASNFKMFSYRLNVPVLMTNTTYSLI